MHQGYLQLYVSQFYYERLTSKDAVFTGPENNLQINKRSENTLLITLNCDHVHGHTVKKTNIYLMKLEFI